MAEAKNGDTVRVHYTGTLDDGSVFDSSDGNDPLEFTLGEGQIIPGFENAVLGMKAGESKRVAIPSGDAYGPFRSEMVQDIERSYIPAEIELEVGRQLMIPQPGAPPLALTIVEITDQAVTVDANHPLAGKDLTFDIRLAEIV